MKRRVLLLSALVAFAAPAAAQAAVSEPVPGFERVQDRRGGGDQAGPRVSLNDVVRRLRSSRQGQMVDARSGSMSGRAVYIIVWEYPGGRIGNIYVDQASGQVVRED